MSTRWTYALSSLAILAFSYVGYARTIVPWMDPPSSVASDQPGLAEKNFTTPSARYAELLAQLFPAGSWELEKDAKIVRNKELLLVLREYETTTDGKLRLNPCTVVYLPQGPDSRSWKIQAAGGAELEFDEPFDLRSGSMGRLQSGFLPGQVTITSTVEDASGATIASAKPDSADRIEIETSGVQLTAQRITAPYDVHFRYGPSFGSGRGLTIDLQQLVRSKATGIDQPSQPVEIRRVELVSLEQLVFFPPRSREMSVTPVLPIRVNCEGPLVLDIESGLATIEKNVLMERAREGQSPDRLLCDRLTAHLRHGAPAALTSGSSPVSGALPSLQLERLVAEGLPAVVTSTTGIGPESRWHRFESERLDYLFAPSGDGSGVGGGFQASGSGRFLTGVPSERVTQMELRWHDRLEIDTSTPGIVNLDMFGNTACRLQQFGEVFAQKLRIGLQGSASRDSQDSIGGLASFGQLRPHSIVAQDEVQILTDRLDAYTQRLDVVIQSQAAPQGPVAGVPSHAPDSLQLAPPRGGGYQDVVVPPDRKFTVQGDRLRINITEASGAHELEEVLLEGHVRCVERSTNKADSPIEMTGNQFRLSNFTRTSGVALINGTPAVVRARQMALSGDNIHVDRDQNQIWIDGRGAATMPLPAQFASRFPNRPGVADIRWEGGLRFDGQSIDCHGGVLMQGPAQRILTDRLVAQLNQQVDLTAAKLDAGAVELSTITADGSVQIENRTMDDTGWLSIERGNVQQLKLDHQAQTIVGTGPGWIETVRRGGALPQIRPASDDAERAGIDQRLSYLRVEFGKGFQGSMSTRTLTFRDRIRSVFGPVSDWDSRLDLQGELQSESARLNCDELTVFQLPGREENPFELSAIGNTSVRGKSTTGQLFDARAQRLSFDPGKDVLMLQGDTRSEAELFHQRRVGGPRSRLNARQIKFWPKANRFKLDGVGMLDLNDLGG